MSEVGVRFLLEAGCSICMQPDIGALTRMVRILSTAWLVNMPCVSVKVHSVNLCNPKFKTL